MDVSNREQVKEVAKQAMDQIGPVDFLINNAGVYSQGEILDLTDNQISKSLIVNAESHFWTVKEFLPSMLERNTGHIVTISSIAGQAGTPGMTHYNASKFACYGFSEALRTEMKRKKSSVKVTTISPYYINTGMFDGVNTTSLYPILEMKPAVTRIMNAIL